MAKLEVKEQLKSLLRELFQLDNADLDFGIYSLDSAFHKDFSDSVLTGIIAQELHHQKQYLEMGIFRYLRLAV
ncbi:MAG: hypothetical protein MUO72_11285 [Bacteroidales bacterium]|nr:hypothetical protein [Bacteroidales bacterium]